MISIIINGRPCSLESFHSRCKLSKAFSKSTNLRYREDCISIDCSMMFRNTKIWFFLSKPCLFLSQLSIKRVVLRGFTLCKRTMLNTLYIVGKSVIPHQLLHSVLSPCFGCFTIVPLFYSDCIMLVLRIS